MLNILGKCISHLLFCPHGVVSHLGGATTYKKNPVKVQHEMIRGLLGCGDGQQIRATAGSPSVQRLWGKNCMTVTRH